VTGAEPTSPRRTRVATPIPTDASSFDLAPDEAAQARALDRFFDGFYRLSPVTATFVGIHDFDDRLPDWSPEGIADSRSALAGMRRSLAAAGLGVLDRRDLARRDWTAIDGALADACLEVQLAELESRHLQRGNPSLAVGEAVFGIIALTGRPFAPAEQRAVAASSRLRAFPLFFDGARRTLTGRSLPDAWRERALRELDGARILLAHLDHWAEASALPATLRDDLGRATGVAAESVAWFRAFVESLPSSSGGYACGAVLSDLLLRRGHWFEGSVDHLRHEAREELESESRHLAHAVADQGAASWGEIAERLMQRHPAAERFLATITETWSACRRLAVDRDLLTWPEYPIRYLALPSWMREAAPHLSYLFYRAPAPYDRLGVADYEVAAPESAPDDGAREAVLRAWNDTVIRLNHVAHHGAIGHHVQNWHAHRSPSRIGQVAAVDAASRIAMFCGGTMAEGWACYATELMEQAGFLDSLDRVAEQQTQVRLRVRAIVDLELHAGRLSFDDAVRMYVEQAGLVPAVARAEVTRNSMFPATAVMYWLGAREIWRLRAAEEEARRDGFSLRGFHDELLSFGSIPLLLVARLMAARRAEPAAPAATASSS
jgi:hypothetical protein